VEKGEEQQVGEAHISGEEVGMHPKTFAVDIEQDRTTTKGVYTVWIC
jgi:hypothetical protein